MKLLFCEDCKDIVCPPYVNLRKKFCNCKRHSVWWIDRYKGTLKVGDNRDKNNRAYVIGLSNKGLLLAPDRQWTKEAVHDNLLNVKAGSLFEATQSLVWRQRPGENENTSWDTK